MAIERAILAPVVTTTLEALEGRRRVHIMDPAACRGVGVAIVAITAGNDTSIDGLNPATSLVTKVETIH
jgi:hypothetical protein